MKLVKTNTQNEDLQKLVIALDKELAITDGEDHDFYNQFNGLDDIHHFVVGYINNKPAACGAIKHYDTGRMEIKRMFVSKNHRGNKYGIDVLTTLEEWSRELGYHTCILETGINQVAAIRLYENAGYRRMENYGQYAGIAHSFCFSKDL